MAGEPESVTAHDRPFRVAVAVLLVVGTAVLLAPARSSGFRLIETLVFLPALAGSVLVGWWFIRGRPWAATVVLLGMLLVQGAFLAGQACMNNLKYLMNVVHPLADGYLFGNILQAARWLGMPTRNLAVCLLSLGTTLAVFLILPTVVVLRHLRTSPPESWTWLRDMTFILVISTLIWDAAMIGLTLRPFTLGYLW